MEQIEKIQILKDMIQIQFVNGDEKAVADYLMILPQMNLLKRRAT